MPEASLRDYPFGEIASQGGSQEDTRYDFTGKERDRGTGLHYFGARYYDAEIGRWVSIDAFSDKYPSMTPYQYAANNPINFIDVNGDSIWIQYEDENGHAQRLLYTQGMDYSGDNEQVATLIGSLNKLNSIFSGNRVLGTLTGSSANYNLGLSGQYGGTYLANAVKQGSGGNIGVANSSNVSGLAHELFHGFQHENSNMINSTAFEVGANLFASHIEYELSGVATLGPAGGSQEFAKAYINLLYNQKFSQRDFNIATRTFLQSSYNPPEPPNYNGLRPIIIKNPVISRFYPLVKFR
ncbi:MAG: RHS repeat-associated core domain-containing protein [bacterium]